jgi:hypothetical protein
MDIGNIAVVAEPNTIRVGTQPSFTKEICMCYLIDELI